MVQILSANKNQDTAAINSSNDGSEIYSNSTQVNNTRESLDSARSLLMEVREDKASEANPFMGIDGEDRGQGINQPPAGGNPDNPIEDFNATITTPVVQEGKREVVIVGAHAGFTVGNMLSDAAGRGTQNEYGSGNNDKTNDAFFGEVYDKVAAAGNADKLAGTGKGSNADLLASYYMDGGRRNAMKNMTSVIIDANSGEIIDQVSNDKLIDYSGVPEMQYKQNWGDYEGNSIEGKDITHNGQEMKVVDSLFRYGSPLVLDLKGDGFEFSSIEDGTQFDLNGDGRKQNISWLAKQDSFDNAFLVLDKNGDGQVNSGKELFGDQNGSADGYKELAKYDSNNDGKIDAQDDVYEKLELWADMNGNGVVDEGEMKGLKEMGVNSISTQNQGQLGEKFDEHGNDISLTGDFEIMVDGQSQTRQSMDVFFIERVEEIQKQSSERQLADSLDSEIAFLKSELQIETLDSSRKSSINSQIQSKESKRNGLSRA